jgi:DmsE family decaheme c-type cytochrome
MRNIRWLVAAVFAVPAAAQGPSPPPAYAGSEVCQVCHEEIGKAFAQSPHQKLETNAKLGWQGKSCEACHGPAQKHTETADPADVRNPERLAAVAADKVCLECHRNEAQQASRFTSSHTKNDVSCVACHKVHANGPHGLVARAAPDINRQCASCHQNVWAQFQKPFHHRLPEQAMSCVDCHNPHGSIQPTMQQAFGANETGCLKCHGDKRGPFTFEHPVVRLEGCGACHEPHGSANPRMLTRHEVRFVCLECHANLPAQSNTNSKLGVVPPSFHDLRTSLFQNCTVCHQKVHGSYVDRNLLR